MSYATAHDDRFLHLDLNTNVVAENPVLDDVADVASSLARYPSRRSDALRQALADEHGLPVDAFVCSNGADAVLDIVLRGLADPGDRVAFPWPGFEMYPYFAGLNHLDTVRVPLGPDLALPLEALAEADADLVLLANPNNPTGETVPPKALVDLADRIDGRLVVDEAYVEYADQPSLLDRMRDDPDLVVVRTMSKAYGLAGLRVGYAAAHPGTAEALARARPPFHLNVLSEALAVRALDDPAFRDRIVDATRTERPRLASALADRGFTPLPSQANFVLAAAPTDPGTLHAALKDRGILVRVFDHDALADHVRVTVGRPEHTDRLAEALDEVVG